MKKLFFIIYVVLLIPALLFSQHQLSFDDYFIDKTMRIDYFQIGDAKEEIVTLDQIYQYEKWAGNPKNLIDPFNNGRYYIKVYDIASNALIYSHGFGCIFGEYKTTDPAMKGFKRTYHGSALIPYPRMPVLFVLETRDKENLLHSLFVRQIDPSEISIIKEKPQDGVKVYEALKNGDPHNKVDLVWIAEGYTESEYTKFKGDVDRFIDLFFGIEPYNKYKKKFNICGVFRASAESGVDEPRKGIYKNTAINSSFNALNTERYLLTEDNRAFRDIAAHVPYDGIVIMVNSERYGGGGIYNDYAISTVDNRLSENVFIHEFGHSFAGLADEYYSSTVAYNDFFPQGVEPTPPNITAFLNPKSMKWEKWVSKGIDLPTQWGKEEAEELEKERQEQYRSMKETVDSMKNDGATAEEIKKETEMLKLKIKAIAEKIAEIKTKYRKLLKDKVGLFEGAGYSSRGLYRPEIECLMFSNRGKQFCRVCQEAISLMIHYYSE